MPLKEGTRLGPYEIVAPIGAGGMGEVYRARDTRLDRTVAIKVLPAEAAGSSSRRRRLDREARTISQLSHPNICALYDVGHQDGIDFLVMEYLDGETLGDRLRKGPLPIDRVVEYAVQIAAALDKAHRHGVTHRDLKPGNIMLTAAGAKLLDFGLAKIGASPEAGAGLLTAAPTEEKPLTSEGALLGTFRYMAPEQLEGKEADARADIWAMGLVIHEMATGKSVFQGSSQASLIAAILERDAPSLAALRPETPPPLDRLVQRCLLKDPEERWQSARDLLHELRWIREGGSGAGASASTLPRADRGRERLLWASLALVLAASLVWALVFLGRGPSMQRRAARFPVPLPENASESTVRVSPDGRFLSFHAESEGRTHIWLRPIDSLTARPLPGTEGIEFWFHFWSPDSRFIGFMAGGKLKKIDIAGGRPQILADAPGSGPFQLGSWGSDGTIIYNINEAPGYNGLYRVSAEGGPAIRLTILDEAGDEVAVAFPAFLPDGRHFIFQGGPAQETGIWVASLDSLRASELLAIESYARYAPPGYLLYASRGALMAHRFDPDSLSLLGEPFPIAEQVETFAGIGIPNFSASDNGILTYDSGRGPSRLVWRDRNGLELGQVGEPDYYASLSLSPDGKRLMVSVDDPQAGTRDLWLIELDRDVASRFTTDGMDVYGPVWSPDGSRLVFSMARNAPPNLHVKSLSGGEARELLPSRGTMHWPSDWSPDGRFLLYTNRDPNADLDLWMLPIAENREPVPFLITRFKEFDARFSPDGRFVAFASEESGESEVYVVPSEGTGEKRRVSIAGGHTPLWRSDGLELFYLSAANQLMAVPVRLEGGFEPGTPTALFTIEPGEAGGEVVYDVAADGRRFIINSALPGTDPAPTVVFDWTAGLPQ